MFKNMSMMEQKTWGSLVITLAVCTYFLSRILGADGIVNLDPAALIWLYIKIVILLMVLEIGHALFLLWHNKNKEISEDERDQLISGRASRNGFWVTLFAIEVFLFTMILQKMYPDMRILNLPAETASDLTFSLFTVLFVGLVAKQLSALFYYRRAI